MFLYTFLFLFFFFLSTFPSTRFSKCETNIFRFPFQFLPFIMFRHKVSLWRYADGISFGKTMEKVVQFGALPLKNVALDKNEIRFNDSE